MRIMPFSIRNRLIPIIYFVLNRFWTNTTRAKRVASGDQMNITIDTKISGLYSQSLQMKMVMVSFQGKKFSLTKTVFVLDKFISDGV